MIKIQLNGCEYYDEKLSQFIYVKGGTLCLEHSLLSISKWESKWHKSFLEDVGKDGHSQKTEEEIIDYIRCMTLNSNEIDDRLYYFINEDQLNQIISYMKDPMTATWFNDKKRKHSSKSEAVTSELIYYWMISYNIPVEFQKWHINRLLTLIRIFDEKQEKPEKMSKREILSRNAALNSARRKARGTKG